MDARAKLLVWAAALLALAAQQSRADGVNLSWDRCGAAGSDIKTFACDTNLGTNTIVGSLVPPLGVTQLTGIEVVIDGCVSASVVPPWWLFKNLGSCRQSSLGMNFFYTDTTCADYWASIGGALGNLAAQQIGNRGPNTFRILGVAAVDQTVAGPVDSSTEYFGFNLTINMAKSVGPDRCDGCQCSAMIILNSIKLDQPAGLGDFNVNSPLLRQSVSWQSRIWDCTGGCSFDAARNATFGRIKALYR